MRCLLLLAPLLTLAAAEEIGVTVAEAGMPGFVDVARAGEAEPFITLPIARIVDLAMADSYVLQDKTLPIRHLAIRVETRDQHGQAKLDVYRVRISDQNPAEVRRILAASR